ncbi:MAG: hypothetical protein EPO36_11215 [Chloroflexota bacterium]|nr:MAG: hypothetical protein EPO36_11215 [Chloroflexota bacterium]
MTTSRDPGALLAAYLDDGMTVLPDRVVAAVLDEVRRTRQRTVFRPWATRSTFSAALSAAAVVALLVVGAALLFQRGKSDVAAPSESPLPSGSPSQPAVVPATPVTNSAGVWIATGTMNTPRVEYSAVRLLDGRVLVLGESGDGSGVTSAEVYDPVTGTWSATGNMIRPIGFPPVLLRDGMVLAGAASDGDRPGAELYDPTSGTWSATGPMVRAGDFVGDTATLLPDGRVLVIGLSAGGPPASCPAFSVCPAGGAELYDPASGTWTAAAPMITPRYYATATVLADGRVLVAGGYVIPDAVTSAVELYDPSTGSWTAVANMPAGFGHHTATLLRDGTVLVAGRSGAPQLNMAVYDPAIGAWTTLPVRPGIAYGTMTLLADGRVLMANDVFDTVAAEVYDPAIGAWITAAPMLRSHAGPAILLLDGTVLVAGGSDCLEQVCVATGAAELYVPAGVVPPALPEFPAPPPPVIPTPTPRPSPYPPATGPVPPNARPWTVTVVNDSAQPATLFLAEDDGSNTLGELCGSVTPNVVPAGSTTEVTLLLPAKNVRGCSLFVNPVPGDPGGLFETSEAPKAGKVWITADGQFGWLSP